MSKTTIVNKTLFSIVTIILIAMINGAAQQSLRAEPNSQQNIPQWLLQRNETGVTAPPPDPDIPRVNVLKEPRFTRGDSNIIFIDSLPDPVEYQGKSFPLDSCYIDVHAMPGQSVNAPRPLYFSAEKKSILFNLSSWLGEPMSYRARLWVPKDTTFVSGEWAGPDSIAVSIQDTTISRLDSLQLVPRNPQNWRNGWLNTIGAVDVGFYGLRDPAGIYRTFLHDNLQNVLQDTIFISDPDGSPGPSPIDSVFFTLKKAAVVEGVNTIYGGACDAAYTPASHGPGTNIASFWTIKGNYSYFLDSVAVKVDTTSPVVMFDSVKDVYSSNDVDDGVVEIPFIITDALSGVDKNEVSAEITSPLKVDQIAVDVQQADTLTGRIIISGIDMDTTAKLKLRAMDVAGNADSVEHELVFRVEPPELTDFRVTDMNFDDEICLKPAFNYTNSTVVRIDSLEYAKGKANSIRITVSHQETANDSVLSLSDSFFEIDLLSIMTGIDSGDKLNIRMAAIDSLGNEQEENIPEHSIIFDNDIADIHVSVRDTTTWIEKLQKDIFPTELGAFPGWTNDVRVLVTVDTAQAVPDVYRMKETDPNDSCYVKPERRFYYQLFEIEQLWPFAFQLCDSAGNESNIASRHITLDTTIYSQLDTSDFKIFDPVTGSEEFTAEDSVYLLFEKWDQIPDLSRIVVNNSIYYPVDENDTLTVPTGTGKFTLVIADSAGNVTTPVLDSIGVVPVFEFEMADSSNLNPAQPDYTNDTTVSWSFVRKNFKLDDLEKIDFYNADLTEPPDDWQPGENMLIHLYELYDSNMEAGSYTVYGRATLKNKISTPNSLMNKDSIIYDKHAPEINEYSLKDIDDSPFEAYSGFTNSLVIDVITSASNDVDSISITGDAEFLNENGQHELPDTLEYSATQRLTLTDTENFDVKNITVAVRDSAGNWSGPAESSITYLKQNITAEIDTVETITLPQTALQENALFYVPVVVSGDYPEYLSKALTFPVTESADTLTTDINIEACETVSNGLRCFVPFKVLERGEQTVILTDSAGNSSNVDKIFFDLQLEPEITTTVYDYSEVPDFHSPTDELPADFLRSDSLFTDGSGDSIVVLTRLVSGNWDSIRIVADFDRKVTDRFKPVAHPESPADLRTIPLQNVPDSLGHISFSVYVKNVAGLKDSASYAIIYDIKPPRLIDFNGPSNTSDSLYSFTYSGKDDAPGELAGIVIREALLENCTNGCDTSYTFIPVGQENKIMLFPQIGLRKLCAFLLDKADVDQNRPELIQERLQRRDFSTIDHQRKMKCYKLRLNPKEVSNFPNPFDPNAESTILLFPLSQDSRLKISILDAFGNLVDQWYTQGEKGLNSYNNNEKLKWDGRNGKGKIVANGGYICVIQALDSGEKFFRKIAVMKK